jgi:hypothetical protein
LVVVPTPLPADVWVGGAVDVDWEEVGIELVLVAGTVSLTNAASNRISQEPTPAHSTRLTVNM